MKEQGKSLGRNPKEVKIRHLSNKEFKEMVIRIVSELECGIEKLRKNSNKELENIRKNQAILKNAITVMKNTLEGIKSRLVNAEEHVSGLEDRLMKVNQ